MSFVQIIIVEPVEENFLIPVRKNVFFPSLGSGKMRDGVQGFYNEYPGFETSQVEAPQNLALGPFHVYF
ncbi:hypothetical protein L905_12535 [Agrobacterium sp. TS43]|nr:hypothetical protein L905_12535 [Agrobacterium sp. TS43]